jgi:acetyl esterase/lipase
MHTDPEVAAGLLALRGTEPIELPVAGDVATRRTGSVATFEFFATLQPADTACEVAEHTLTATDGTELPARWYSTGSSAPEVPGPAVLYLHGGGMIVGSVALYDQIIRRYVRASGVPMLAVDYRLAPEHPDPTPVTDCYTGLEYLAAHASELGVDLDRIAVMGDSAGGGLAAGVALLARDRSGPALRRQILIYPMLDDRTRVPDPAISDEITWNYADNVTGWDALLGTAPTEVSPYAAPARVPSVAGLPDTYLEVGELDIFRDEDVQYANRLWAAGISTELHVHPGAPHGFENHAPTAAVSQRAMADRVRVLRSL